MKRWMSFALVTTGLIVALSSGAFADQPVNWQLGLQAAASPVMEGINAFHNFILVIITLITLFVLALLVYCILRFNEKANPEPSRTSHNTMLEVVWTVVPIIILVIIAIPSFRLLYYEQAIPEADMTIKTIGHEWYWGYEYPDHEDISFLSFMLQDDQLEDGDPRLLAVDEDMVVPVGATVRMVVTASRVLHNWAIPAFGVKMDAVPGRINEAWFRADREGVYYGQCSELCGTAHAFMPIAVRVVSQEAFDAWVNEKIALKTGETPEQVAERRAREAAEENASLDTDDINLAAVDAL